MGSYRTPSTRPESLGDQFAQGKVSCLRMAADGDSIANFVGKVAKINVPGLSGTFVLFDATDASSGDLFDDETFVDSATCHDPTGSTTPVTSGSIDIRPLPA